MAILFTIIGLVFSYGVVYYVLKNDEDFVEKSPFPNNKISAVFVLIFIFISVFTHYKLSNTIWTYLLNTSFLSLCFVVSYIDFYVKYIHDMILIVFAILILAFKIIIGVEDFISLFIPPIIGMAFYGLIYILARLYYKREAFGQGDVLLIGVCGLMFDPIMIVITSFVAFYVAAIVLILVKVMGKSIDTMQEIAFGPYICIASWLVMCYGSDIIAIFNR